MSEQSGPIEDVEIDDLVAALHRVIAKGLPVDDETAGDLLPNLKSVYARSVVPSDRRSRVSALNELLPRLIAKMADAEFREAEQQLFSLAPGTRGSKLTDRRRQAAETRNYSLDHFRDVIEEQMLRGVAVAIYDDLLHYRSKVKRSAESLEPTGDTPTLGPEHITHEEELISRIWQHVYGLRAELIAFARLSGAEEYEQQAEDHRQTALREEVQLQALIKEYSDVYGDKLIRHGDAEFAKDSLERLAGWKI